MTDIFVEPSLAVQSAIRNRLINSPSVMARVDPAAIVDSTARPERYPCILLGESQTVDASKSWPRRHTRVYTTLHIWTKGPDLTSTKSIVGVVRAQLANITRTSTPLFFNGGDPFQLVSSLISGTRAISDPSGEFGHGIVTFEALVEESAFGADVNSGPWEGQNRWLLYP